MIAANIGGVQCGGSVWTCSPLGQSCHNLLNQHSGAVLALGKVCEVVVEQLDIAFVFSLVELQLEPRAPGEKPADRQVQLDVGDFHADAGPRAAAKVEHVLVQPLALGLVQPAFWKKLGRLGEDLRVEVGVVLGRGDDGLEQVPKSTDVCLRHQTGDTLLTPRGITQSLYPMS